MGVLVVRQATQSCTVTSFQPHRIRAGEGMVEGGGFDIPLCSSIVTIPCRAPSGATIYCGSIVYIQPMVNIF